LFLNQMYQFRNNNNKLTVGTNLPASKAWVYYMAKCPVGITTFTFSVKRNDSVVLASDSHSCNTTLQYYAFRVDFSTSTAGQYVGFTGGTANAVDVAWVAIRPDVADFDGLTLAGAGAAIATGPNSGTTSGHAVCYGDTLGTQVDCGTAPGGSPAMTGQTTGYLPKATSATGSTTSSAVDDGVTAANQLTIHENYLELISGSGVRFRGTCTTTGSRCDAVEVLNAGTTGSESGRILQANGTEYWRDGITAFAGVPKWEIRDGTNSHTILSFPNNTMPANSIGGNTNGATAITQPASDNSTNIATDAFVKSNLPLAATTVSIGGTSLSAGACTSGTANVTGATTSMAVVATPATYPGDGMDWRTYVSSSGVVTVKVCAVVAGTPTASTYNVRVIP
jgi:hypothetical protein